MGFMSPFPILKPPAVNGEVQKHDVLGDILGSVPAGPAPRATYLDAL